MHLELAAAQQVDDILERAAPAAARGLGIRAQRSDVERRREAFERSAEVDHGGAKDALQHGFDVGQLSGAACYAVEAFLLLVGGGEDGALAPEEIDVAGEGEGRFVFLEHELFAHRLQLRGAVAR